MPQDTSFSSFGNGSATDVMDLNLDFEADGPRKERKARRVKDRNQNQGEVPNEGAGKKTLKRRTSFGASGELLLKLANKSMTNVTDAAKKTVSTFKKGLVAEKQEDADSDKDQAAEARDYVRENRERRTTGQNEQTRASSRSRVSVSSRSLSRSNPASCSNSRRSHSKSKHSRSGNRRTASGVKDRNHSDPDLDFVEIDDRGNRPSRRAPARVPRSRSAQNLMDYANDQEETYLPRRMPRSRSSRGLMESGRPRSSRDLTRSEEQVSPRQNRRLLLENSRVPSRRAVLEKHGAMARAQSSRAILTSRDVAVSESSESLSSVSSPRQLMQETERRRVMPPKRESVGNLMSLMDPTRHPKEECPEWACSCGEPNKERHKFCGLCGTPRPEEKRMSGWDCSSCGKPENCLTFCRGCGSHWSGVADNADMHSSAPTILDLGALDKSSSDSSESSGDSSQSSLTSYVPKKDL